MSSQNKKRQKLTPDLVPESDEETVAEPKSDEAEETSSKLSPRKNKDNEYYFDIGKNRRVTVRKFKGNCYVDIREFYEDENGEKRPGKKGISLSTEQWNLIKALLDPIDSQIKALK
jgi:hypothetical protein